MPVKKEGINLFDFLEVNRPLELIVKTKQGNKRVLKSYVADFTWTQIFIPPLVAEGHFTELKRGETVEAVYLGEGAVYQFQAVCCGRKKENNLLLTILENPCEVKRVQRRSFYRLACDIHAQYKKGAIVKKKKGSVFVPSGQPQSCFLADISAGGISFHSKELFEGDVFYLEMKFILWIGGEREQIKILVRVLRKKRVLTIDKKDGFKHTYAARFVAMNAELESKIARFVLQKQIEARREKFT